MTVKLIIFTQIIIREDSSRAKRSFFQNQFLLFGKIFELKLLYSNKGKVMLQCVKDLSMEIKSGCNEFVSSNILEEQDKFSPNKNVYHFIRFIFPLQSLLKVKLYNKTI